MNTSCYYYIVYFDCEKPITCYNDLVINKDNCYVVYSRPYTTQKMAIKKVNNYTKTCSVIYNAVNETCLYNSRHAGCDKRLFHILFSWSLRHIPKKYMLETILEACEVEACEVEVEACEVEVEACEVEDNNITQ